MKLKLFLVDWRVKPLVLIVKLWAQKHQINSAHHSSLSSYSLALMVIHFLQTGLEIPILPCLQQIYPEKFSNTRNIATIDMNEEFTPYQTENQEGIGELFAKFLRHYANFE